MSRRLRHEHGQGLIEVIVGFTVIVPFMLLGLDLLVIVIANSANDVLAKNCARLAANQIDSDQARASAQKMVRRFPHSSLIPRVELFEDHFLHDSRNVKVETVMTVRLPVALPGLNPQPVFHAVDVEPIVGMSNPVK